MQSSIKCPRLQFWVTKKGSLSSKLQAQIPSLKRQTDKKCQFMANLEPDSVSAFGWWWAELSNSDWLWQQSMWWLEKSSPKSICRDDSEAYFALKWINLKWLTPPKLVVTDCGCDYCFRHGQGRHYEVDVVWQTAVISFTARRGARCVWRKFFKEHFFALNWDI